MTFHALENLKNRLSQIVPLDHASANALLSDAIICARKTFGENSPHISKLEHVQFEDPRATLNKPSKSTACADTSRRIGLKSQKLTFRPINADFRPVFASAVRGFPNSGRNYPAVRGRVKYRFASASATNARVVFFSKPR